MPVEENKKGIGNAIAETRKELKKVQWPKRHELIKYTGIVISSIFLVSLLIFGVDSVLGFVVKSISL